MGDKSNIEWTDASWNPIRGCTRVSEGCRNCYAERMAARFSGPGMAYEGLAKQTPDGPRWTGELRLIEKHLRDPIRWQKPRRIFVNSMSDMFHESLSNETIARVFRVICEANHGVRCHTYQILTKRAERMVDWFQWAKKHEGGWFHPHTGLLDLGRVWLGVSVEDQKTADARIPLLLETPAAVRFISAEPLLAPVDLVGERWRRFNDTTGTMGYSSVHGLTGANLHPDRCECQGDDPIPHKHHRDYDDHRCARCGPCKAYSPASPATIPGLDWVIVGGESGPMARPCETEWIESIVKQCKTASVPVFVKQLGSVPTVRLFAPDPMSGGSRSSRGRLWLKSRKGGSPDEWPEHLRVRQFPS